jgi:hypothetical protein
MTTYAFMAPILPGKMEDYKRFNAELKGPKKKEHEASRERAGVSRELEFLQRTPMGDMVVIVLEAADPAKAMESLMTSKDPFDLWFFSKVKEIHGFDVTQEMPMNELIHEVKS